MNSDQIQPKTDDDFRIFHTSDWHLAALESLWQDNKTVGVISHVGLLKERISAQSVVEKNAGGVSGIRIVPEVSSA